MATAKIYHDRPHFEGSTYQTHEGPASVFVPVKGEMSRGEVGGVQHVEAIAATAERKPEPEVRHIPKQGKKHERNKHQHRK